MSTSKTTTQMAALLVALGASCTVFAQSGSYGAGSSGTTGANTGSTMRHGAAAEGDLGTGNSALGAGTVAPSGAVGTSGQSGSGLSGNSSLDNLPPSAAGVTDNAPSTFNPDKGPHTVNKMSTNGLNDPVRILQSSDGEGSSGVPTRRFQDR